MVGERREVRPLVQASTPRVQLSHVFLLLLVGQDLVDEHAGEDADEDANNRQAKHGPEAGVYGAVDDLAVGRGGEDISGCSLVVDGAVVHDASKAGAGPGAGLVDTLTQGLQPVHVDHGGGHRHQHAH